LDKRNLSFLSLSCLSDFSDSSSYSSSLSLSEITTKLPTRLLIPLSSTSSSLSLSSSGYSSTSSSLDSSILVIFLRSLSSAFFRSRTVVRKIARNLTFCFDSIKATKLFLKISKNMRIMLTDNGFFLPIRLAKAVPTNLVLRTSVTVFYLF